MNEKDESNTSNGLYRHKETGAVVTLTNDPAFGSPLTNAFIKAGYEYVGEADEAAQGAENHVPAKTGRPLADYKLKELVEIAKELGLENAEELGKPGATKDAAIAAIEAAQDAKEDE